MKRRPTSAPALISNLGDCLRLPAREQDVAFVDLIDPEAPRSFTARELDDAIGAFANGLRARDIGPGQRIAIIAANRVEFVIAYFGAMRAGCVATPVNYKLSRDTVHHILNDARCAVAVVDAERHSSLPPGFPAIDMDDGSQFQSFLVHGACKTFRPAPHTLAEILYTSGSTGMPKGVPLTHAGQCWALNKQLEVIPESDEIRRTLVVAPLYHMNALFFTTVALANRMTVYSMPKFEAQAYLGAVARYRCSMLTGVPTMFALAARAPLRPAPLDLAHVTRVQMGSSPVTESLISQVRSLFPLAEVTNGYGTTEAGPAIFGAHPEGLVRPATSVGYPLQDISWRFANGSQTEGPFEVRTPALTTGYLNRPEADGEKFRGGWYSTGDIMRRDGFGFFYFVGRLDDMFVVGGENVYPGEVQSLIERHPGVAQAGVVAVPHDTKGMVPVAFVVPRGDAYSPEDIAAFTLANGPPYAYPRHVFFIDALPLASTNKIDVAALAQEAARRIARK